MVHLAQAFSAADNTDGPKFNFHGVTVLLELGVSGGCPGGQRRTHHRCMATTCEPARQSSSIR